MSYENNSIFWVEVDRISPNPYQPRKEFDEGKLQELADSIRMYGMLQPLTVTRKEHEREDGGIAVEYELIAGERRLRASKLAGLAQVPVIIRAGEETERVKLELAIIENLQREDLNPVDRALAFQQLKKEFSLTDKEIAQKVGRSRVYVANTLRLLHLPDHILNALRDQKITEGHGRSLLMLKDRPEELETLFRETLLKKLSVRDVERISRKIAVDKVRKKDWGIEPELLELERQLTESLGTRVQIEKKDYGGRLVIDYFEAADVRKILDMLEHKEALAQSAGTESGDSRENEAEMERLTSATPLVHDAVEPQGHDARPPHEVSATVPERYPNTSPIDTSTELQTNTEPEQGETQEIEKVEEEKKDTKDEDTDLYSIKNFSV